MADVDLRSASCVLLTVAVLTAGCGGDASQRGGGRTGDASGAPTHPLDPDIWIADLHEDASGAVTLGSPREAIHRDGYDNQPAFLPDGSGLWFTATDVMTGQADIWRYDLASGGVAQVTVSAPESEYSAAPLPDGTGISVVRVEADSTQRLWRFGADGSGAAPLVPDVAPVGYYAWAGPDTVAMFVLGDPPTLRTASIRGGPARVVARGIGRSIQPIPGSDDVSFVQLAEGGGATVMRLRAATGDVEPIVEAVAGGDDHAWTPDGVLLMSQDGKILAHAPGGSGWVVAADYSSAGVEITRLAVSPDGTHIALVVGPSANGPGLNP